ncbi:MAG: transcriptional repressor [Phycisphaerales bacterium]|nr:transcriptional repressor [Phycisphaerales bacterium]
MARAGERRTRQRENILRVIADAGAPVAPREILTRVQSRLKGLGLATVYRTLKLLAESGVVRLVEIPGDPPRYELADKEHHHHFSCRLCACVYEVPGCCGHFEEHLPAGFRLESHEVILFGICQTCGAGRQARESAGSSARALKRTPSGRAKARR